MNRMKHVALAALLGSGVLALASTGASARIICNEDGDCWHVKEMYDYQPGFRLTVHPDDWQWKQDEKYRWREHEGRGYWRGGVWVQF
ncbi:hypothetical protein GCM10007874_39810 [Labrys miyagiensis]|uniref:Uncharacterized protein n=1 Tax=Labrys miyagiensis TaxID=346912 RepID=A0ABQ6CL99_9HYPH|nr:hypothetical protein [Labrys miyagiensis]GLS20964.1 hypothetical protein GCM10007874_39810 [Labrys miyagiensis]